MTSNRDAPVLVFSPHLDDAVLGVGASLAALTEQGRSVVVCTVFAGAPSGPSSAIAAEFHRECGLTQAPVRTRRAEDQDALTELGVKPLYLEFLDAVYRRHGDEWLCRRSDSVFDPALPDEPQLATALLNTARAVIREHRPAAVWTCLPTGNHVDHRHTVLTAALACAAEGIDLLLWEPLPYALTTTIHPPGAPGPNPVNPGPRHLARKLSSVARYRSQLNMLFGADWAEQICRYAHHRRRATGAAEPLWRLGERTATTTKDSRRLR